MGAKRAMVALITLATTFLVACVAPPTPPPATPTTAPATPTALPESPTVAEPTAPVPSPTPLGRQTADPTSVVVFAASRLGGAFSEIGGTFMLSNSDATGVSYKFDDPAMLRGLIQQGADADVFATTDTAQMTALQQANFLDGPPAVLVRNRLVIVVSKANPQGIQGLKDLANTGVRFIIPGPAEPTTAAIHATFEKAGSDSAYGADFATRADRNVLARDGNDPFVVSRIISGEVNAGVVYASAMDPDTRKQVQVIDIPDAVNSVVDYPIAVLKNGTNARGGRAFVTYVLSSPAQAVFTRWGYVKAP